MVIWRVPDRADAVSSDVSDCPDDVAEVDWSSTISVEAFRDGVNWAIVLVTSLILFLSCSLVLLRVCSR